MKRKTAIALAAVVTAGLLTACSGNDTKKEGGKEPETQISASSDKKIVVACSGTAVPYSYIEDDEHKGFEVDMWNEISQRSGYDVEMKTTGFSAIFGMLDSGQADVAGNFFGMSDERMEKYDASIPYAADTVAIAVNKDNEDIKSKEGLAGKKVAVSEGAQGQQVAADLNKEVDFELITYGAEGTTAMQELSLGRVEAWIESSLTISLDSKGAGLEFKTLEPKLTKKNVGYFVKKNDEASKIKLDAVNQALEEMLSDGTVKELSEKWFYTDVTADIE